MGELRIKNYYLGNKLFDKKTFL